MASEVLRAVLEGQDNGLQDALDEVASASRTAARQLERVDDKLDSISGASSGAAGSLNKAAGELSDVTQNAGAASETVDAADESMEDLAGSSSVVGPALNRVARTAEELAAAGGQSSAGIGKLDRAIKDIRDSGAASSGSIDTLENAISSLKSSSIESKTTLNEAKREVNALARSSSGTDAAVTNLRGELENLAQAGGATEQGVSRAESALEELAQAAGPEASSSVQLIEEAIQDLQAESISSAGAVQQLENAMEEISSSAGEGVPTVASLESAIDDLRGSSYSAGRALNSVGRNAQSITINAEGAEINISGLSDAMLEVAGTSQAAAQGIDNAEDQAEEATTGFFGTMAASLGLSGTLKELAATLEGTDGQLDDAADEADDMRNSFLEAAGAAQALQLSSSALSINVGFMTVALRNATTQIPALVAGLGTLSTAMIGVAGAAGLAAAGIAGVLAGGLMAQMEGMTGPLEDATTKMEAMQAISKELGSMFIEATEPLREMEGAADAFKSVMEGIMTTVRAFSEGIRRSFEAGEELFGIKDFMDIVGDAWMSNLQDIIAGFQTLFHNIGPPLANTLASVIEHFDEFAMFVSDVTLNVIELFGQLKDGAGDFTTSMIDLGMAIGSGLVPVFNLFFDVMSSVADIVSGAGMEFVATAVQIAGMLLILNKIAGVMSTFLALAGAIPATLARAAGSANSFTGAIVNMGGEIRGFINSNVQGLSRLGQTIQSLIPFQTGLTASIRNFGASVERAGGPLAVMRALMTKLASTAANTARRVLLSSETFQEVNDSVSSMTPSLDSATDSMSRYASSIAGSLRPSNIFNVGTTKMADGLDFMRSKAASAAATLASSFRQAVAGAGGAMLLAGKHVSLVGQYLSTLANTALRGALAGFINLRYAAIQARLSFNQFATQAITTVLGSLISVRTSLDKTVAKWNRMTATTRKGIPFDESTLAFFGDDMINSDEVLTGISGLRARAVGRVRDMGDRLGDTVSTFSQRIGWAEHLDPDVLSEIEGPSSTDYSKAVFSGPRGVLHKFSKNVRSTLSSTYEDITTMGSKKISELRRSWKFSYIEMRNEARRTVEDAVDSITSMPGRVMGSLGGFKEMGLSAMGDFKEGIVGTDIDDFVGDGLETVNLSDSVSGEPVGDIKLGILTRAKMRLGGLKDSAFEAGRSVKEFGGNMLNSLRSVDGFSGAMEAVNSRLPNVGTAIGSMIPSLGGLSDSLRNAEMGAINMSNAASFVNSSFARMVGGIASVIPFTGLLDRKFMSLTFSMHASGGATARLAQAMQTLRPVMKGHIGLTTGLKGAMNAMLGANLNASFSFERLRSSVAGVIPFSQAMNQSFARLGGRLIRSGGLTAQLGQAMVALSHTMAGNLGLTKGLRATLAGLAGVEATASAQTIAFGLAESFAAAMSQLLTGGISLLTGVLATLATALGAVVALLGAVVLIGGAVALALAQLGQSGESAESIISGLRDTFVDIAETVAPIFVESANMIMDVINSILAPVFELIDGFKSIAVSLGFVDEEAANQGGMEGFMSLLESSVGPIVNLLDTIGDFARVLGGEAASAVSDMMNQLERFLVDINFGDKVRFYIDTMKDLAKQVMDLKEPFADFIDNSIGRFMDILDNLISTTMEVADAFKEALGLGGGGGGGGGMFETVVGFMKELYSVIIGLVEPALNLLGSIMDAVGGIFNVVIDIVGGILILFAKLIGAIRSVINAFLGVFGMDLAGLFSAGADAGLGLLSALGPIMDALAGIIDVGIIVGDVLMSVFSGIISMIETVLSPAIDIIMIGFRSIAKIVGTVFKKIMGIITGVIDFIIGYFSTLVESIKMAMSGDIMGAIGNLVGFLKQSFINALAFLAGIFTDIGKIIVNAFKEAFLTVIDAIVGLPQAFADIFANIGSGIADAIAGPWDEHIAGEILSVSIPDWVPEYGGNTWSLDIPTIGGTGGDSGGDGGGGGGGGGEGSETIEESNFSSDDMMAGADTAGALKDRASEAVMPGGPSNGVTYNEGDQMNQYNQDISADAEDKAQMSRIAKDAMAEANSFSRRQQGGQ